MLVGFVALGPVAQASGAPGASADAYGLWVDVKLVATMVPVDVGPISHASQDFPPGAADPAEAHVLSAGPAPSDGSVVNHVGVLTATASAKGAPQGLATAEVADVSLLKSSSGPAITADVVRAQANSDCSDDPNATGTAFVKLKINGTPIEYTPAPNTVIDLGVAKVILNEQHLANDGRGIVVNAIHVLSTGTGDAIFRGDVIVSHAMSTVACPNGQGSTGGDSAISFIKRATPTAVAPGDTVTYDAKIKNTSTASCLVTKFIEHLAAPFNFVSTSGVDLILGNGKTIAAGATASQRFVVKVKDDAKFGVYYNNLEIFCANIGNFVKGLDAPVTVVGLRINSPSPTTSVLGTRLQNTGIGLSVAAMALLGLVLLPFGLMLRARSSRATQP